MTPTLPIRYFSLEIEIKIAVNDNDCQFENDKPPASKSPQVQVMPGNFAFTKRRRGVPAQVRNIRASVIAS
jgi:hypothetical protein